MLCSKSFPNTEIVHSIVCLRLRLCRLCGWSAYCRSKWGIHKLGAIYFTLRNFSPKYNSALHNIHLVSLFHAQDIKTYGFSKILDPLVQDVKILERDGIRLPLYDDLVYGTIVKVTGDNFGLHCLFGFVESFSARCCCRFCFAFGFHSSFYLLLGICF